MEGGREEEKEGKKRRGVEGRIIFFSGYEK